MTDPDKTYALRVVRTQRSVTTRLVCAKSPEDARKVGLVNPSNAPWRNIETNYARRFHRWSSPTIACAGEDSNHDGYVTCTIAQAPGTPTEQIRCPSNYLIEGEHDVPHGQRAEHAVGNQWRSIGRTARDAESRPGSRSSFESVSASSSKRTAHSDRCSR